MVAPFPSSLLSERIVILTGAGISQESGLATFRDEGGLWASHSIEDVCTPEGFSRNPALVDDFYNHRRKEAQTVEPNAAHKALAMLETALRDQMQHEVDDRFLLITQNIDPLHERAGSRSLVHMHGELERVRCTACHLSFQWITDCFPTTPCPHCGAAALRPDVVWFGEMPYHMERIEKALARCTLFIAIGTSATVSPAAGFVQAAGAHAHTVELNLAPSAASGQFDEVLYGPATKVVPRYVSGLLTP